MKPLEGMLVVAVEQAVAAPLCTARLLDAGARVIKIERKEGDFARGYDQAARGDSSYFVWTNQGKESVVLDFKTKRGAAQLHKLIEKADVFIQNLASGALKRAGFGATQLRAKYPHLITCDISGYGDNKAMRGMKAYDFLVQAETGLVSISGGASEMGRIGVSICDIGAGITAHAGIVEALLLRERTDQGSGVEVSLFDVAAEWMTVPLMHHEYGDGGPSRQGLQHPSIAPYEAYTTKDGKQTIIAIQNEREWSRLCRDVLGKPGLASDPRFSSNNNRICNRKMMNKEIMAVVSNLTTEEFRQRMLDASIAFGTLNTLDVLARHPAVRRKTVLNGKGDKLSIPTHPICRSDDNKQHTQGMPGLGEHTDIVLAEIDKQVS